MTIRSSFYEIQLIELAQVITAVDCEICQIEKGRYIVHVILSP